jgi:peptide/nickel transport system permease protein
MALTARSGLWQAVRQSRSGLLGRLLGHRLFMTGIVLFAVVVAIALLAGILATFDPIEMRARNRFKPPNLINWFGTDSFGRDVYSRLVFGSRLSLEIGLGTVTATAIFGTLAGVVAGYFRRLDNAVMRAMDALMAFPSLFLALAVAAALGPSTINAVIALAVVYIPRTARIARASVLVARDLDYVEAARAVGAGHARIVWRHVLPNCLAPLIIQLTFVFAYAVLQEAILSFLGVGPPPPAPSWGNIIAEGKDYIREAPWICFFPGAAIAVTVLGLNLLGDGLRDVLDPRMKVQQG